MYNCTCGIRSTTNYLVSRYKQKGIVKPNCQTQDFMGVQLLANGVCIRSGCHNCLISNNVCTGSQAHAERERALVLILCAYKEGHWCPVKAIRRFYVKPADWRQRVGPPLNSGGNFHKALKLRSYTVHMLFNFCLRRTCECK